MPTAIGHLLVWSKGCGPEVVRPCAVTAQAAVLKARDGGWRALAGNWRRKAELAVLSELIMFPAKQNHKHGVASLLAFNSGE
jgi:hypothetical protein